MKRISWPVIVVSLLLFLVQLKEQTSASPSGLRSIVEDKWPLQQIEIEDQQIGRRSFLSKRFIWDANESETDNDNDDENDDDDDDDESDMDQNTESSRSSSKQSTITLSADPNQQQQQQKQLMAQQASPNHGPTQNSTQMHDQKSGLLPDVPRILKGFGMGMGSFALGR